jgi:hypothetical protein
MSDNDSWLGDPDRGAGLATGSATHPATGSATHPAGGPVPTAPVGPADSAKAAGPAPTAVDGRGAELVGAVDALGAVPSEPVHTHAARYHEVHTLLQDALSATDRPGS